jgi:hypothetical protein
MRDDKSPKKILAELDLTAASSEEEFEEAIDLLAQCLLFETPWQESFKDNPRIRRKIAILEDVPLVCRAMDCPYAQRCPIMKALETDAERVALVGTPCRADKIYAVEQFAAFVKELQIEPEQTTDIVNVASLVRLMLYKRRIDWTLAIEGLIDREPRVIDQKSGQVYYTKVVHPLIKVSEQIEKQISQLHKQLMADRQSRAALAATMGRSSVDILHGLFTGKLLESDNPIEADFTDISETKEE